MRTAHTRRFDELRMLRGSVRRRRLERFATLFGIAPLFPLASASLSQQAGIDVFSNHPVEQLGDQDEMDGDDDPWGAIGGGRINEKVRRHAIDGKSTADSSSSSSPVFDPANVRSHLWHALEGMDRYPNYLARWKDVRDMERLEAALLEKAAAVRRQREAVAERRTSLRQLAQEMRRRSERWDRLLRTPETWDEVGERILHPDAASAIFGSKTWKSSSSPPSVSDVLSGRIKVELDTGKLTQLMDEEFFDVYSFQLLSRGFCEEIREFVRELVNLAQSKEETFHLHVGRRPVDLDSAGLSWVNDLLFHLVARPISRHLFASTEAAGGDLDWRNGFVAGYSATPENATPRERLVTHTDDSEVTLNCCLGEDDFEGGWLEFRGFRGTKHGGEDITGTYKPVVGKALLHAGRHFHDVTEVTTGNRFALIMWGRSLRGIRSQVCPCCWLNRREKDGTCICGPSWN